LGSARIQKGPVVIGNQKPLTSDIEHPTSNIQARDSKLIIEVSLDVEVWNLELSPIVHRPLTRL
jgi:hypothetical protein